MKDMVLGKTKIVVGRVGFGALPIQRISKDEAKVILLKAYASGINFYDTARGYSDSEEKLGYALSHVRENIVLASKTSATTSKEVKGHLQISLEKLKTNYIDIYQLHNPSSLPDPEDPDSSYYALLEAKKKGYIHHIGITNHKADVAAEAVKSGLYETLQFPFSLLCSKIDQDLVSLCKEKNVGFIAMKALSGGLISNVPAAFAFLWQYDNVIPIWGIQKMSELEEFITLEKNPPAIDKDMWAAIEKERIGLQGSFCRGCGYCMPCPVGIPISTAARISLLIKRAPYMGFLKDDFKEQMDLVKDCIGCGQCIDKCPYSLNTPELLKAEYIKYSDFYNTMKG